MKDASLDFQEIYKDYYAKIFYFLKSKVGEYNAEDLTQDVFIKIHRGLPHFRGDAKITTWIYRIAANAATDLLRSPALKKDHKDIEGTGPEHQREIEDINVWTGKKAYSAEEKIIREEMYDCMLNYIEQLPEDLRDVYILSELERFSNKEISGILNISLDNTKIRLHRARSAIKKILNANCNSYINDRGEIMCEPKCECGEE